MKMVSCNQQPNEDGDYYAETFEAKEIMDCSLCGNNLSPIPKNYNGDSLGAYLNNDDDNHGQGSSFLAIGECNNCNLTYFSPPIRDGGGLKSKVLCNNWAEGDGEGGFCAYPFDWNEMWEKRCEKCESGLHGRKGEIDRLNEHDCMDNSKVEIIEGDMILLECEICKKTKQYVSNQKSFNVEFNEWADQEMNSHGKNISFKDWSKDEGLKHGNTEITEWAQHEDESHDARYGAENYRYIKPVPISHSGGGDKYNGYYAIKGYEESTADGFTYRILSSPGTSDWYRVYIYDTEKMFKNKSRRLNPSGKMVGSSDPASHLIGSFPRLDDAKRALVFRMIQDEQYHHILSDGNLNWLLHGKNPGSRKWKAESEGKKRSGILSDPFEEASLDSGGTKKVLLGIGLVIIGYFGYNKWK